MVRPAEEREDKTEEAMKPSAHPWRSSAVSRFSP
jgi:hypothetical protein